VSLAHSFFAASHWSFVHFSTCVGIEALDESVADVAGAGFVTGGDAEVCAIAALDRTAARNAPVRQKLIRDMRVFLLLRFKCWMAASKKRSANQLSKSNPQNFVLICVKTSKSTIVLV
jgi:hypothetical protein